jgi:hypothetical protein
LATILQVADYQFFTRFLNFVQLFVQVPNTPPGRQWVVLCRVIGGIAVEEGFDGQF